MRRRIAVLVISMLTIVACHDDGGGGDAPRNAGTNQEWCQGEWDDGLAPPGWDHDKLMRDCLDGLEIGYTREEIHTIYREMRLNNK